MEVLCVCTEKKGVLHQTETSMRPSNNYLMTIFHLNTTWSQELRQKIALCLLALWDAIIADKIEEPIDDNSGLSPTVVSKCGISGFFQGSICGSL